MALFLRDEDVRQIVTMEQMLAAIESMQDHFGRGEAYNLARRKINVSGGKFSVMGGGLFYDGVVGAKTYTYINGTYSFHVSLYDAETGKLLCDTQSNRLGQLRTGATTGVAVKYLSNPDAATLGIIGTGYQAPTQLEVVCKVRNIRKIKAYSRTSDKRASFAGSMTEALGIEVISAENTQQTVSGSDVVICIAATKKPVLEGHWLAAGHDYHRSRAHHLACPGGGRGYCEQGRQDIRGHPRAGAIRVRRNGRYDGPGTAVLEPATGITPRGRGDDTGPRWQGPGRLRQADGQRRG